MAFDDDSITNHTLTHEHISPLTVTLCMLVIVVVDSLTWKGFSAGAAVFREHYQFGEHVNQKRNQSDLLSTSALHAISA